MEQPARPRRWYQFSIASSLWLLLVVAIVIFGIQERRMRGLVDLENATIRAENAALKKEKKDMANIWEDREFMFHELESMRAKLDKLQAAPPAK